MSETDENFRKYLSAILPLDLYVNLSDQYIEGLIRSYLRNKGRQKGLSDEELGATLKRETIQINIQEFLKEVRLNGLGSDRAAFLLKTIESIFSFNQTAKDKNQE